MVEVDDPVELVPLLPSGLDHRSKDGVCRHRVLGAVSRGCAELEGSWNVPGCEALRYSRSLRHEELCRSAKPLKCISRGC